MKSLKESFEDFDRSQFRREIASQMRDCDFEMFANNKYPRCFRFTANESLYQIAFGIDTKCRLDERTYDATIFKVNGTYDGSIFKPTGDASPAYKTRPATHMRNY